YCTAVHHSGDQPARRSFPTRRSSDLLEPAAVHGEKLKVLRSLAPITRRNVQDHTVRGQYVEGNSGGHPVPGYLQEEGAQPHSDRSEEHTSELQSRENLVCRLLLEKKK